MSRIKLLAAASVTGVVMAGLTVSPAFAWHPKGVIVKSVQNQTTGSVLSDANTSATAVSAKPGDVLRYVIEVRNDGATAANGTNDMAKTVMTDTLPAGVQLVSDPAKRTLTANLGTITPGKKVTTEYIVKVVAETDGLLENKACFTGDSTANDNPQKGCDVADVKVTVPPKPPVTPVTPVTPEQPVTPQVQAAAVEVPATLPNTGAGTFLAPLAAVVAGGAGYAGRLLRIKRRTNQ
jgi:uncharacterized repeat protein (TIGR01451 family)